MVYESFDQKSRIDVINAIGLHLARVVQDNRQETDGVGDYTGDFLKLLNQRIGEYSRCQFDPEEGPSFVFLRLVGDHVTASMGERDAKWITGYIIDVVGNQMFNNLKRILPGLLDPAQNARSIDPMRAQNYD